MTSKDLSQGVRCALLRSLSLQGHVHVVKNAKFLFIPSSLDNSKMPFEQLFLDDPLSNLNFFFQKDYCKIGDKKMLFF